MANITRLTDELWTGGDLPDDAVASTHVREWVDAGIGTIIDCRHEWTDEEFVVDIAPELRYVHLGIDDAGQRVPFAWFDLVIEVAQSTPPGRGVLAHCHMGINRGPSAAFAIMLASGHSPVDAIDLIRTARPIAAIGYAEDALRWWHRRSEADSGRRRRERDQLARWRHKNPHDTVRIIRQLNQEVEQ